jgi:hypothetical protein
MIKWIFTIGLIYFIFKLSKSLSAKQNPSVSSAKREKVPSSDELVEDPECGVYIPKEGALKDKEGNCFCSLKCMETFASKKVDEK